MAGKRFERDRRKTVLTASFHILSRLLEKIRSALPLVNVELKEGPEDRKITGLRSGSFDVCIRHLSRTYDQIENMLLIQERLVVALPKGHSAAPVALEEPCFNLILKSSALQTERRLTEMNHLRHPTEVQSLCNRAK